MSDPVRWGIVSTANINEKVLAGVSGSPAVSVVAVASRTREYAQGFAGHHGIPRAHGSYEELLADDEVEAVYIPLPNGMHVEWTLAALEAGKHVLCEKPLSARAEEVERCFDAAESAGLVLSEAFMWRHHPQAQRLESLVREGAIGELRLVRAAFSFPLPQAPNVRWDADLDGGALLDVGCYCVSGARLLAGAEPERVTGEAVMASSGVDSRFAGTLRFPGEVLAVFDCGFDLPPRDELEAIGSEGSLFLDDPWHCMEPRIELRGLDGSVELIEVERANPYGLEFEDVSAAIRGEREPRLGRADAVGQARALEALLRSASEGRPVAVA
ncbi:MAG TPA: Gfo/Idh/MocA family oxidoreductase [Thermoleophilaceae bacterium]|nr:Gfo/Idh/MocA family oxidoreductase [Thermoleophilaceae bacterium]